MGLFIDFHFNSFEVIFLQQKENLLSFPHVGHRVGEVAHDYVPALKLWLSTKGIKNSYDSWHGMLL